MRRALTTLLFVALLLPGLAAQSVRWEPAESGLSNAIVLVFENCEPDGQPPLPALPGVTFSPAGRSDSTNIVNFQMTRSVALSYLVRGPQNPPIQIPSFTVKTNKGDLRVPAFNVAAPAAPLDSVASARLIPSRTSVWVGEVFGLNYELSASRRTNPQISPTFDWNAAPLVAEDWSKPEVSEGAVGGERRVKVLFRTRAVAKTPNQVKLEAANHLLSIQTGTIGFGIISQPRMEQVSVTSDQPVIEVRPLPPGAPAGFAGAVGQFRLVSKVVPEKAAVGEPVTWTLELSGTGNWPDIEGLPSRSVSNQFQIVQPKAKRTPAEGRLFDLTLTEDVVLVPSKAGNYALGPVAFSYFDPQSGGYKTVTAPRTMLVITAPTAPQFNVLPAPGPAAGGETAPPPAAEPAAPRKPLVAPPAPASLPRDPLPGPGDARTPLLPSTLAVHLALPVIALCGWWGWLALRRARDTDPLRARREARARLARTLATLAEGSPARRDALLLAWQRDAALLWDLHHAAPSPRALLAAGRGGTAAEDSSGWAALWAEVDRALYGVNTPPPSDWVARAQAALASKPLPPFRPLRLFLPRNLMPFAALLAVGMLVTTVWLRAAAPSDTEGQGAYRKADFTGAEKAWRQAVEKSATDWVARHNLSLALEQQDKAGESAAQAAAAFVQRPGHPAVRWHLTHTAEKLGSLPPPLTGFADPGFVHTLARAASPADWQRVLIAAAWLGAIAAGGLLFRSYGHGHPFLRPASLALLGAGLLTATTATAGLVNYGATARIDAAIVARATVLRSIPTEADTMQKTSALSVGSLAIVDKTFLGWRRLAFANGQTGWVRKEEIVPIWK